MTTFLDTPGTGNLRGTEPFPRAARRALADTQMRHNVGKATRTIRGKRLAAVPRYAPADGHEFTAEAVVPVWDVDSGKEIMAFKTTGVLLHALAFSADGEHCSPSAAGRTGQRGRPGSSSGTLPPAGCGIR